MAETGGVTRFTHHEALTAFAGVDPGKNHSGQHIQKSVRTSKKLAKLTEASLSKHAASSSVHLLTMLFKLLWIRNWQRETLTMGGLSGLYFSIYIFADSAPLSYIQCKIWLFLLPIWQATLFLLSYNELVNKGRRDTK